MAAFAASEFSKNSKNIHLLGKVQRNTRQYYVMPGVPLHLQSSGPK